MSAWDDVRVERERQDALWGDQNHPPIEWMTILAKEVGEATREAVRTRFKGENGYDVLASYHLYLYREKMTHVAAVAIAAIECLDQQRGER